MKAVVFDRFGGPEVLRETTVSKPEPGPGQVRIRVMAAGVNPLDGKIRSGALEQLFPTALPAIPGLEAAGVVDALGEGVTDVAVGDAVLGWSDTGSYAQYALASTYAVKPEALSWQDAAALPVAGDTARRVLGQLHLSAGETLLIHGATGAVGTVAVQLAVASGVHVIGTAGAANLDYLASLGATATPYGDGLVARVRALAPNGVDAVFDVAGKGALPDSIELRGGTGRIVTIADFQAGALGVAFSAGTPEDRSAADLADLAERAARATLSTTVSGVYPLDQAAAAHRLSDTGHVRGKLVLTLA